MKSGKYIDNGKSEKFKAAFCLTNLSEENSNKFVLEPSVPEGIVLPIIGDVNDDGIINLTDVITLIDYLLNEDQSLINPQSADCKIDGIINLEDITALIDYMLNETW